jgi:hypothetical protein
MIMANLFVMRQKYMVRADVLAAQALVRASKKAM